MKERIKKFFRNRKPEDIIIATVPAAVIGILASMRMRGMEPMAGCHFTEDDGTSVVGVMLKNGQEIYFAKPPEG